MGEAGCARVETDESGRERAVMRRAVRAARLAVCVARARRRARAPHAQVDAMRGLRAMLRSSWVPRSRSRSVENVVINTPPVLVSVVSRQQLPRFFTALKSPRSSSVDATRDHVRASRETAAGGASPSASRESRERCVDARTTRRVLLCAREATPSRRARETKARLVGIAGKRHEARASARACLSRPFTTVGGDPEVSDGRLFA